jgi:hypothetical protein
LFSTFESFFLFVAGSTGAVRNVLVEIGVKSATNALTTVMIGSVGLLVVGLVYRRYRGSVLGVVSSISRATGDAFRNSYQASKTYTHDMWSATTKKAESYNPVTAIKKWNPPSLPSMPSLPSSLTSWKKNPPASVPSSATLPSSSLSSSGVTDGAKKAFDDTSKVVQDTWKKLQTPAATSSASSPPVATSANPTKKATSSSTSETSDTPVSLPDAKSPSSVPSLSYLSSSVSSTFSNLSSTVSSSLSSLQKDYLLKSKSPDEKKGPPKATSDSAPSSEQSSLSFSALAKTLEKIKSSAIPTTMNQSHDAPVQKSPSKEEEKKDAIKEVKFKAGEDVKSPSGSWKDNLTSFWKKK